MRLRGACGPLLLAVALAVFSPPPAAAQTLTTYDDFSSAEIDGGRWVGYAYTVRFADLVPLEGGWNNAVENPSVRHPRFSTTNVSSLRRIVGGQLQLQVDSRGGMHPDPDVAPGHGRIGVRGRFGTGGVIQARVTPMAADAPGCQTTGNSRVRAQVVTHLLARSDGDQEGLVFATLSLDRSSLGGDRIYAVVSRCRDYECDVAEDIGWVIFDRAWTLASAHTLTIRHESTDNRVVFTVAGGGAPAESRMLGIPPPSDGFVVDTRFELRVETTPANCPATASAPDARIPVSMDARFDNVRRGAP